MPTTAILESHPVSVLKKEISKTNIKGYSKMKKAELIILMMKTENKPRFHHIKMREGKAKEITIVPKRKKIQRPEKAKKISAPKREAQKAKVIAPKKRVASIPKVIKGKVEMTFAAALKKHDFDFYEGKLMSEKINNYELGVGDNISYNGDYEELPGFSSAQAKRYRKLVNLDDDEMTSKQQEQKEKLNEKFLEGIGALVGKRIQKAERAFKKEHMTRKKRTLKEWIKIWDEFLESVDLDDYM
tara:strand:- start:1339 stop:2067 length:729 start_codon:yes stop_codon:yes gene_type:complete